MCKLLLFFAFLTAFSQSFAQTAPDFTFTDTDGNQWNLYTELGKGKTVLLDFFYADCTPCQTYTPEIVQVNNDYGAGAGKLTVWGISDRDNNQRIKQFDQGLGVNYSSCGTEGGGDTITNLYISWFSFVAWPTYAVVCPDKSIAWNLPKSQGLPEIRDAIDNCPDLTKVSDLKKPSASYQVYPIPSSEKLNIKSDIAGPVEISLYEITSGKKVIFKQKYFVDEALSIPLAGINTGIYTLVIINSDGEQAIIKVPVVSK